MEKVLRQRIKDAMIAKNADKSIENVAICQALKSILETAQKVAKDKKTDITDSMIVDAAKKEIKQLNELKAFCKADNIDKITEIEVGIRTASEMLPSMVSDTELRLFIESNKTIASNIGEMMKLLKSTFNDSLDGKMASTLVKELL